MKHLVRYKMKIFMSGKNTYILPDINYKVIEILKFSTKTYNKLILKEGKQI